MSQYPVNSTAKQYYDADWKPTTLWRLVRDEPEWAVSRIQAGEQAIAQRDELLTTMKQIKENAGNPEFVYRASKEAIAKAVQP